MLVSVCQQERPLLSGLYVHPVAQPSPDGRYIAVYMMEGWMLYPVDCLLNGEQCSPFPLDSFMDDTRVAWGVDGATLAYLTGETGTDLNIRSRGCWDAALAQDCFAQSVPLSAGRFFRQPAWSVDGSQLAFIGLIPRGLYILNTACLDIPNNCLDQMMLVPVSSGMLFTPSFSPDGHKLLYSEQDVNGSEQIYIVDLATLSVRQLTLDGNSNAPAWSADGRYITYVSFENLSDGDADIYILDLPRNLTVKAISASGMDLAYPIWIP